MRLPFRGRPAVLASACTLLLGLQGCASLFHQPPPTVNIPVPVPCVKPDDRPKRPALVTKAELDAYTDYQYVLGLERHRILSEAYVGELEALVDTCSRLGPAQ